MTTQRTPHPGAPAAGDHRAHAVEAPDPQLLTTYRYLRMSLITLLALLAAAVVIQAVAVAPQPLLDSISAYYWTPVRSVFVGALVAIGVGMVVLKADNEVEDIFLNIGGVLAPVVAFVPVPPGGVCPASQTLPQTTIDGIVNNVSALLAAGVVALGIFFFLVRVAQVDPTTRVRRSVPRAIRIARVVGTVATVAVFAAGAIWFFAGRASFGCWGHDASAITLFGCIIAVTILNAVTRTFEKSSSGRHRPRLNTYTVLAVLMALVLVIGLVLSHVWEYSVLFIEAGVLTLFLSFWIVQSRELWTRGVRHRGQAPSLLPRRASG